MSRGPLAGLRIVEMAGLGPAPFCAMLFSDLGADVVRIDRAGSSNPVGLEYDVLNRGRRLVELDLKSAAGRDAAEALINQADGLIEGFRPGVMERLGLGPECFSQSNPRLVFGRMTGWGQDGPLSHTAGHDINYLAITGMLSAIGPAEKPAVPLNLVGDFGGGALYLAFGMVSAILEARGSGRGQVVDAAISDGAAHLGAMIFGMEAAGLWNSRRQSNVLDGGAAFYDCYECAGGEFLSIGAIEPRFQSVLLRALGLDEDLVVTDMDAKKHERLRQALTATIRTQSLEHWTRLLQERDACTAPVLSMSQASTHPHNVARKVFVEHQGVMQPAPAPRFSRTTTSLQPWSQHDAVDHRDILAEWNRI